MADYTLGDGFRRPKNQSPTLPTSRALSRSLSDDPQAQKSPPSSSQSSGSSIEQRKSSKSDPTSSHHEAPRQSTPRKRHASLPRPHRRRSNENDQGPSPTDSHPRAHARTRSRESVSTLLLLTTDRLTQETARANAAERQNTELLARMRSNHERQAQLDRELQKVKEELSLYKIQLDLAQREILRAQVIVDDVERQRVAAESRASRNRDRARKLMEDRIISEALEEGRKEGFREGLARGRAAAVAEPPPEVRRPRRNTMDIPTQRKSTPPPNQHQIPIPTAPRQRSPPIMDDDTQTLTPRASSRRPVRTVESAPEREQTPTPPHVPDTARFRQRLPVPVVTTPIPLQVPSTQPQPIPDHVPSRPTSSPEDIDVRTPTPPRGRSIDQIHPISIRNRSPSVSHPSIILPPDGYIPMLGADNSISLPPPHELSIPVRPIVDEPTQSHNIHAHSHETAPRARDYAYETPGMTHAPAQLPRQKAQADDAIANIPQASRPATTSVTSHGSTRISQYDIVSPPRDRERERSRARSRSDLASPTPQPKVRTNSRTKPQQMAEQWRFENSDILKALSSSSASVTSSRRPRGYSVQGEIASQVGGSTEIERPKTVEPKPNRPRSPRVTGGPRIQRDPVQPGRHNASTLLGQAVAAVAGGDPFRQIYTLGQEILLPESHASTENHPSKTPPQRTQTPGLISRSRHPMQRSMTTTTIPDIGVEPPSKSPSNISEGTAVDPVLLTPESATVPQLPPSHPIPHMDQPFVGYYAAPPLPTFNYGKHDARIDVPANGLPPGFVPLNPIPAMSNLRPSDQGFYSNPMTNNDWIASGVYTRPPLTPHATDAIPQIYTSSGRGMTFSPAPLNRPISLFSED